jgi:DNA-binding transcriptional LysR family regulator
MPGSTAKMDPRPDHGETSYKGSGRLKGLKAVITGGDSGIGTIRITATEYATSAILLPKLARLLRAYPDIKVEIISDYGLTDIVTQRFDAGVRDGEQVAKDMIAVRIAPDARMAVVGAPSYFRNRREPKKPQELVEHNCINLRLPTHGGLYAWEFEKSSRELKVRVEGQLFFNTTTQMLDAGLAGLGLTYLPEGLVQPHINKGRLKRVLEDWCPPYPGYHLYYPCSPSAPMRQIEGLHEGRISGSS